MFDTELGVCLLGNGLVISAEYRIEYIYCIIVDQSVQSTVNIGPDISKLNSIRNVHDADDLFHFPTRSVKLTSIRRVHFLLVILISYSYNLSLSAIISY